MVMRTAPLATSEFVPLDSGVYVGTIQSITEVERDADMYHEQPYSQFEVVWAIEEEDREEPFTLKSWFSISVNPKSNISTKLLPALGLDPIKPGDEWDEDTWLNLSCQLQVERFTRSDGRESNRIVGYMAMPKRKKSPLF